MKQSGQKPSLKILACVPLEGWREHEMYFIKKYKDMGYDLFNRECCPHPFTNHRTKAIGEIIPMVRVFVHSGIISNTLRFLSE